MSEQPISAEATIGERTGFSGWAVAILVTAALAVGGAWVQIGQHGSRLDKQEDKLERTSTDVQELKDDVRWIRQWAEGRK